MNLSARSFEPRLDAWLSAAAPEPQTIHYSTHHEGWCSAWLHRIDVAACENSEHAFVRLWRRRERLLEEIDVIGRALFLESLPAEPYLPLPEADWTQETSSLIGGIVEAIGERRARGEVSSADYDPRDTRTYWGTFIDGKRVHEADLPPLEPFVRGIALKKVWNEMIFFVEIGRSYGLFEWATGA